ncbi:hypothetical protein ILUMI_10966 [Ignelater luminosus]|uniref:Uncharacterized protein n=1 Tax=Ignelater luminosus TaxID=2038154 RepID=A0A8K0D134_IGNLU|nr:hypothetical protein ILUMI_10966 [Ignelater luminosus]
MVLKADIGSNIIASVQAYKMASNEYRFFPVTFKANVCSEYNRNSFSMKDMLKKSSNLNPCDLKKGLYYVDMLALDYSKWPPHMPVGSYKLDIDMYVNLDVVIRVNIYGRILDKPIDWKNIPKRIWNK